MSRHLLALGIALLMGPSVAVIPGQKSSSPVQDVAKPARFELTVDGIMRGPDLVGYPLTGLRWSADPHHLFFDWRRPGEQESSTYAMSREGGQLRKLSDEVKAAPAANGRLDEAHRRVLFVDGGDVVLVDSVCGTRRQITRRPARILTLFEDNLRTAHDGKAT